MQARYAPGTAGVAGERLGSNVQDGQYTSFDTGFGDARVVDSNWGGRRGMQTATGWFHQDLREPDRSITPYVSSTGDYSWLNRVATVYNSKRTGEKFLPLPGGYSLSPGEITRGGAYPVVTDVAGGTTAPLVFNIGLGADGKARAGENYALKAETDKSLVNEGDQIDGVNKGFGTLSSASALRTGPAYNGQFAGLAGVKQKYR
jgi:hypothetical protein